VRARLPGFERVWPPDSYPFARPRPGAAIEGELLLGVDARSLAALDRYEEEGLLYMRTAAVVDCGGKPRACHVYLPRREPRQDRAPGRHASRARA